MAKKILVVDDERKIRQILMRMLVDKGFQVNSAEDGKSAVIAVKQYSPDLILLDLKMPGMDGMQTLQTLFGEGFTGKVIIITAYGTIPNAVDAMRLGAFDYITKPFVNDELALTIERALHQDRIERELKDARRRLDEKYSIDGIVTANPKMIDLLALVKRVAHSNTSVLITGESGTGKELLAKAIHQHSKRKNKPFVAINCSALPQTLIESELFGFKRGAFSGADRSKAGLVEEADGGTLFLDEVIEMGAEAQAKLLRFTQSGEFIPLGSTETQRVDVRILAASNKNVERAIQDGTFRADLFYRLNVANLNIPPLRDRQDDIPLLTDHFLKVNSKEMGKEGYRFSQKAIDMLQFYDWPGNVRELENAVKSSLAMTTENPIPVDFLPMTMKSKISSDHYSQISGISTESLTAQTEYAEKLIIERALAENNGNRTHTARQLGISRNTLIRKINKFRIP